MRNLCHSKKKVTYKQVIYDGIWFKEEMLKWWKKKIKLNEVGYESVMLAPAEVEI